MALNREEPPEHQTHRPSKVRMSRAVSLLTPCIPTQDRAMRPQSSRGMGGDS